MSCWIAEQASLPLVVWHNQRLAIWHLGHKKSGGLELFWFFRLVWHALRHVPRHWPVGRQSALRHCDKRLFRGVHRYLKFCLQDGRPILPSPCHPGMSPQSSEDSHHHAKCLHCHNWLTIACPTSLPCALRRCSRWEIGEMWSSVIHRRYKTPN